MRTHTYTLPHLFRDSIATYTLTPLAGMGVLRLEKMYLIILGANVGTTVTGIMAALANTHTHTPTPTHTHSLSHKHICISGSFHSSITTSTLTPLVGMGVLRLEKMYPITLGGNVGTTVTGIMAALANTHTHTHTHTHTQHTLTHTHTHTHTRARARARFHTSVHVYLPLFTVPSRLPRSPLWWAQASFA